MIIIWSSPTSWRLSEPVPFTIVTPEYGSPYSLTGAGILKGREEDDMILEVFDYIVNDFFLYDKMHYSPEILIENQERKMENYPEKLTERYKIEKEDNLTGFQILEKICRDRDHLASCA